MRGLAAATRLIGVGLACAAVATLGASTVPSSDAALASGVALASGARSTASAACTARQLAASVESSSGAAGTTVIRIALRNTGARCTLGGFPTLRLASDGASVPARTVHGGMALLETRADTVQLAPGGRAYLLVAASELPGGGSRDTASSGAPGCSSASQVAIWLNGWRQPVRVPVHVTACSGGLLRTSPFLHPAASARSGSGAGSTAAAGAGGLQTRPSPGDL